MTPLLRLVDLTRSFGALRAVDHVTLSIAAGARHGLIGPNGAGKSTLINLIAGGIRPTTGTIWFGGTDITAQPTHRRARTGIARTWQHAAVYDPLTVLDNVALAVPAQPLLAARHHRAAVEPARDTLAAVGLSAHADTPAGQLPYGQRRLLELAMALAGQPRLLLLDEPSAGLSTADTAALARMLRALPADITILLVDHNLELLAEVADTVTVMHHGAHVTTGNPSTIKADPTVRRAYLGTQPPTPTPRGTGVRVPAGPVLTVRNLRAGYAGEPVLSGVDLNLAAGQVLAVVGRNGAGKTTLMNTIAGLHPATPPTLIDLAGTTITNTSPRRRVRAGLALVPQGRHLFAGLTVDEHLALPAPRRDRPGGFTRADVFDLLPALAGRRRHRPHQLSGGEQQLLALARALLTTPRVLLLDEPCEGLAPRVIDQVTVVIDHLADRGVAVLLAEQNLAMALRVADQVCVLDRGRVALRASAAALRADRTPLDDLLTIPAGPSGTALTAGSTS